MAKLDRSKPYGESLGHAHIKFIQGDKFFSEQGEEIDETGKKVKGPGRPPKEEDTPASASASDAPQADAPQSDAGANK